MILKYKNCIYCLSWMRSTCEYGPYARAVLTARLIAVSAYRAVNMKTDITFPCSILHEDTGF